MTDDKRGPDLDRPEELVRDFDALKHEVRAAGRVPDFGAMMARAKEQAAGDEPTPVRIRRWAPLAAAAAVAALLLSGLPGDDDEREFERLVASYSETAGTWRSPTASLMDIPGVDLGAVPSFGGAPGVVTPPGSEPVEGRDS
ncbi:MAG: hypothetical protein R3253_15940 [Longimicrobiales bacterium]|nr:hypothetical protein [Longimicrobiales bacterium]